MIVAPVNDHVCLTSITDVVRDLVQQRDPVIAEISGRFTSTGELAAWVRSLPQRDDVGAPCDGPKMESCDPPQRLRIPADDPNCVERTALYIAAAEFLDPKPSRAMATLDTKHGKHTLPVENGEPVILDPRQTRNALRGALAVCGPTPIRMSPAQAVDFVTELAVDPAVTAPGGAELVSGAREVMRAVLVGAVIPDDAIDDVAITLALAEREARAYGSAGVQIVLTTALALADLDRAARRNRAQLGIGPFSLFPDLEVLARLARVGGRLGVRTGATALRALLAGFGVSDSLVREMETELGREGLTLGLLAKPLPDLDLLTAAKRAA